MVSITQSPRCPACGAPLDAAAPNACASCGTTTPQSPPVQPVRTPLTSALQRLSKTVSGDFDHDGWFEICGWSDHKLHAVDVIDSMVMWTLAGWNDDHDLFAGPGRVYVAGLHELTAINAYTGARLWTLEVINVREVHDPGFVPNGAIWILIDDDEVLAVDRATGARRESIVAPDSAGLFRTVLGRRLVVYDGAQVTVLDAAQDAPVLELGSRPANVQDIVETLGVAMTKGQSAPVQPDSVESAVLHRGVVYAVFTHELPERYSGGGYGDRTAHVLVAHRVSDGSVVGRRTLYIAGHRTSGDPDLPRDMVGVFAGFPVSGNGTTLRRLPDGESWTAGGRGDPQIDSATGVAGLLVVHVKRDGAGSSTRHDLLALDAASFTPVWQLDDLGYVISELMFTHDRVHYALDQGEHHKVVAVDGASGRELWWANVPSEAGLQVGGGLVVQAATGTTLLAETGRHLFPKDARSSEPVAPLPAPAPEQLPTWNIEAMPDRKPAASAPGGSKAWLVALALAIAAAVIAVLAKR